MAATLLLLLLLVRPGRRAEGGGAAVLGALDHHQGLQVRPGDVPVAQFLAEYIIQAFTHTYIHT